jgi:hypothetical protein
LAPEPQTAFISYSREDSEFALKLAEDLKAAGAAVWLDQLDIQPGQRWARAVQDALNDCPRMLVILSPSSVDSTNVEDEVSFALEEKKTVIPVLYRECKIPFRLRPLQHLDFRTDYPRGLQGLLKTGAVTMAVVPAPAPGIVTSVPEGEGFNPPAPDSSPEWITEPAIRTPESAPALASAPASEPVAGKALPSWRKQISGTSEHLVAVTFVTPQSGWAVGYGGTILHTDDGGRTWRPQSSGTKSGARSIAFVTPLSGLV